VDIKRIARPEIVAMKAYESARSVAGADGILLNANEAPFTLLNESQWDDLELNRYPSPQPEHLQRRLAGLYGVDPENLLITRGSDEGIDLLMRVFCRPGRDAMVQCPPCFGMYAIAATVQGASVIDVPRLPEAGLTMDFPALEQTLISREDVRLVFLTSPNNPTGELLELQQLERLLKCCENRALLVLDEAYIEFCDARSACSLIADWPQLVVLRTLSKAWAGAGLRCGSLMADAGVIGLLKRVMAPYPLSATAVDAALQVTGENAIVRQQQLFRLVKAQKQGLLEFLSQCDWVKQVWAGEANFVLLKVNDAALLVDWFARQGIRIRDFSAQAQLYNCVRISIGSRQEMDALKGVLKAYGEQQ